MWRDVSAGLEIIAGFLRGAILELELGSDCDIATSLEELEQAYDEGSSQHEGMRSDSKTTAILGILYQQDEPKDWRQHVAVSMGVQFLHGFSNQAPGLR